MNLHLFTIAFLISALPLSSSAKQAISLNKGDFVAAERKSQKGETLIRVRLSQSGKAKLRKFSEETVNKEIHSEIAGVISNFKLREAIKGDELEMGPYSPVESQRVISEINKR